MTPAPSRLRNTSARAPRIVVATWWATSLLTCPCAFAQTEERKTADADAQPSVSAPKKPSPWLFAPVFTSNPKLGMTLGATAGYLHLSTQSRALPCSLQPGQYSNTDSMVAGVFARTSFNADHQRLNVATSLRQHQE